MQAIAMCGIGKRLRSKKMRNPRMAQIATLLYQYSRIVPRGGTFRDRKVALTEFFGFFDDSTDMLPEPNPAASSIEFLRRLTAGFGLLG